MALQRTRVYQLGVGQNFDDEGFVARFEPHTFDAREPNKIKRFQWVDVNFRSEVGGTITIKFTPDFRWPKAVSRTFSLVQAGRERMTKRVNIGIYARSIQVEVSATVGGSNDYLMGVESRMVLVRRPGLPTNYLLVEQSPVVDESGNFVGEFDTAARAEQILVDESDNNVVDENSFQIKGATEFSRLKIYSLTYGVQFYRSISA